MRKQTKIAALLSATALLAIGASMTAFAATGWVQENGIWSFYNNNGEKVTSKWEKSADKWFYLDENGEMATDTLIDDDSNFFYVKSDGAMVTNDWVAVDNSGDESEDAPATVWYYFQGNGKAYKASTSGNTSFKTINGKKYAFDADGKMLFGWVNGDSTRATGEDGWQGAEYYLGDENDGAQVNNAWAHIEVVDNNKPDDPDQTYWFRFQANGKKIHADSTIGQIYVEKTVNGKKYAFGPNGNMLAEWVSTPPTASDVNAYKYFSDPDDGARKTKGWFKVVPSADFDADNSADNDNVEKWYYATNSGKLYNNVLKSINGKKYLFNDKGAMVSGLVHVEFAASPSNAVVAINAIDSDAKIDTYTGIGNVTTIYGYTGNSGVYYFGAADDGAMKTGNVNVTVDGDSYSFKLVASGSKKGMGINGLDNKSAYYIGGNKVKADSDAKFDIFLADQHDRIVANPKVATVFAAYTSSESTAKTNGLSDHLPAAYHVPANHKLVLISSTGAVIKSGAKIDGDDFKIHVNKGVVTGITQSK